MAATAGFLPTPTASPLQMAQQCFPFNAFAAGMNFPQIALQPEVKIELENADLWAKFHAQTTEMIVTKSGRRMFPTLRFTLSGLQQAESYAVLVEIAAADDRRYKFAGGRWQVAGRADPPPSAPRLCTHADSPALGSIWMRRPLSFHRLKLTNNMHDPQGNVLLSSRQKYVPRLLVVRVADCAPPQLVASAVFPEAAFIAVTAYQNERVTNLKIEHNNFAKGFRDGEKKRAAVSPGNLHETPTKRRRESVSEEERSPEPLVIVDGDSDATAVQSPPVLTEEQTRADEPEKQWRPPTPPTLANTPTSTPTQTKLPPPPSTQPFALANQFLPSPQQAFMQASPFAAAAWPYGLPPSPFMPFGGMLNPMLLAAMAAQQQRLPMGIPQQNPFLPVFRHK